MTAPQDVPCCVPVASEILDETEAAHLAMLLKALADPTRLRLLSLVANSAGGEACACDLVDPIGRSQPTISHHLGQLVDAGLLSREKRGKWAWYRLVPATLDQITAALAVPALPAPTPIPTPAPVG